LIHLIPQLTRTLERDYLPCRQDCIFASGRIPSLSFPFVFHAKLTEPTYQYIITGRERPLNNLKKGFCDLNGLILGKAKSSGNLYNDIEFRQRHL
jgi:hypothetical protein